jgi:mannose-1-phosphate guanylyltransferase
LLLPSTHASITRLAEHPELLGEIFPGLAKTSIDYGVMEPVSAGHGSAHVAAVALPVQWRDVGGYASLAEILGTDTAGNAISGLSVSIDASDNVVVNSEPGSVIGLLGVSGLVVVRTAQATLVCSAADAERIKELVAAVTEQAGPQFA